MKIYYKNRYSETLIIEKVPGMMILKLLYSHTFMKPLLKFIVANKFLSSFYGKLMKSGKSKKKISKFVSEYNINMNESEKSISEFNSFNDFFIRKLKPNARPIDPNPYSIISPADGKILIYKDIDNTKFFSIKGNKFNIDILLQNNELSKTFQNCSIVIIRLAPTDYHRFHFPCPSVAQETHEIAGYYYSVSPIALTKLPNIFCQNKRTLCEVHNEQIGKYIIMEIGATMVGSIINTSPPHTQMSKGEEKGYFEFGGSTVVLLTQKGKIKFDDDLLLNSNEGIETKICMGEQIGLFDI